MSVLPWYRRMPPNTFSIAFGLAGLTMMWAAMDAIVVDVGILVPVLTALSTIVWLALVAAYLVKISGPGLLQKDLDDPLMGPFVSMIFVVGLLNGAAMHQLGLLWAKYVVLACAIGALIFGGWITGHWIIVKIPAQALTPAYFLPTVAGGLIAATALQSVGYVDLALMSLGVGLVCWVLVGSIVQYRLWTGPPLPPPLVPLLAIELAPAAVAGNAWVAMQPQMNPVQWALIGYSLLMVMVQIRLIPQYRRLSFTPTFWAFCFSYAATATYALHWLKIDEWPGGTLVAWVIALAVTVLVVWVGGRTVAAMRAGNYFPPTLEQASSTTSG